MVRATAEGLGTSAILRHTGKAKQPVWHRQVTRPRHPRHRPQKFRTFLDPVAADLPDTQPVPVILDHDTTHQTRGYTRSWRRILRALALHAYLPVPGCTRWRAWASSLSAGMGYLSACSEIMSPPWRSWGTPCIRTWWSTTIRRRARWCGVGIPRRS